MTDLDLTNRLRVLRRTVLMLQTELRHKHVDEDLMAGIDEQMERGISMEPRCSQLRTRVDVLRESTITPRPELFADAVRACERLLDGIEEVMQRLR